MRIAAGIMLVIGGVIGLLQGMSLAILGELLGLLLLLWAGFMLAGGIFCFRRRYWGLCLVAAILSAGIIPIIFICVRKREWEQTEPHP